MFSLPSDGGCAERRRPGRPGRGRTTSAAQPLAAAALPAPVRRPVRLADARRARGHRGGHRRAARGRSRWSTGRWPGRTWPGCTSSAGLALLVGLVEALLIFIRRWVQSSSSVAMEAAIRDDVYAHLQRLPASFHDRWHSGQLLSRITSDLSVLRRFLSFGLLFLVLNLVTYLLVVVLLIRLHPVLGLLVAASAVPLFLISPPLRPALPRRVPADAGPAGRRGHPGRGDRAGVAHHEGVRAGPAVDRPVRRRHPGAARHRGRQGSPARPYLRPARPGAQPDPGRRARGGHRGGRRRPRSPSANWSPSSASN